MKAVPGFLTFTGTVNGILFEGRLVHVKGYKYVKNANYINGLPNYHLELREDVKLGDSKMVSISCLEEGIHHKSLINFTKFTPGSVVAFRYTLFVIT